MNKNVSLAIKKAVSNLDRIENKDLDAFKNKKLNEFIGYFIGFLKSTSLTVALIIFIFSLL